MYCRSCGAQIPDDSLFCPKCGTKVVTIQQPQAQPQPVRTYVDYHESNLTPSQQVYSNTQNYYQTQPPRKKSKHAWIWAVIVMSVILLLLAVSSSPVQNNIVTTTPTPTPVPTATPRPVTAYSGQVLIAPSYEQVCPLEIKADSGNDYYIRLVYIKAPSYTLETRQRKSNATAPYESDLAFYVKAGKTVKVDVPIGVYKLYYATGDTFYGTKLLFGDDTSCYTSDEYLEFYADSQYYQGCTLTLYAVANGNYDTDPINESAFPTD